jgi:hypothetical protein
MAAVSFLQEQTYLKIKIPSNVIQGQANIFIYPRFNVFPEPLQMSVVTFQHQKNEKLTLDSPPQTRPTPWPSSSLDLLSHNYLHPVRVTVRLPPRHPQ